MGFRRITTTAGQHRDELTGTYMVSSVLQCARCRVDVNWAIGKQVTV